MKIDEKSYCLAMSIAMLLLWGFMSVLCGCSTELGFNPDSDSEAAADAANAVAETGQAIPTAALRFIELPDSEKGRTSVESEECYTEGTITTADGGLILLRCCRENVKIGAGLRVAPYAVGSDVTTSVSVPSGSLVTDVDVIFGPHGTVFSPPALFILRVEGLELSNEDPKNTGFYYYNEESDVWELQDAVIDMDCIEGRIRVRAELYHFSRYAVAFTN
jgi:hypothetical protein